MSRFQFKVLILKTFDGLKYTVNQNHEFENVKNRMYTNVVSNE